MNDGKHTFSLLRKFCVMLALALLCVLINGTETRGQTARPAQAPLAEDETVWDDLFETVVGHKSGAHYTWLDEEGNVVTMTAITPAVGDTYIGEDNRLHEVVSVEEDRTVRTTYRETIKLPSVFADAQAAESVRWSFWPFKAKVTPTASSSDEDDVIGIYHTHNAESYVQSSGEEFIEPHGEIIDVGAVLAAALEEKGFAVIHSDASHLPHDGGAYQRSRGTVRELLEEQAVALIDVHRDAIPAEEYITTVNGEEMTKIRLVVGRQNPNREANLELAQRIKSIADEQYPGLIKGIFNAHGNYNQDVGPRTILLEFGTHETSAAQAAKSARLFADVYPAAAGLTAGSKQAADRQIGGAALRSAFWFILLAAGAGFGYLWIDEGSAQGAWQRVRTFFQRETGRLKSGPGGEGEDS